MARTIRASEIGSYLFCQKAWKFQSQGQKSENQKKMFSGTSMHHEHGRDVIAKGFSRGLAILFLIAASAAFALHLLSIKI